MMHKKSPGAVRKDVRSANAHNKGKGAASPTRARGRHQAGGKTDASGFSRQNTKYQATKAKTSQNTRTRGSGKTRKPWGLGKKVLVGASAAIAALLIVAAVSVLLFLHDIDTKIAIGDAQMNKLDIELVRPQSAEEPYYVLLVGSDSRDPGAMGAGNSDTIMLARIDPEKPAVSLVSIPRDVEVNLPEHGSQKINAAYAFDGPAGAVNAVSGLCGVSIAHYVEIDFQGVIELVDVLGGIDVNLPVDVELDGVFIPAGEQRVNGAQALVISRCRTFPDGDFTRVKNQRIILQAVAKAVLSAGAAEMPGLITRLAECVRTDVSSTGAISLLLKLQGLDTATGMDMATVPVDFNPHDGLSFLAVKEPGFSEMMARFRNGEPLEPPPAEEQPQNQPSGVAEGRAEGQRQADAQTEGQWQEGV